MKKGNFRESEFHQTMIKKRKKVMHNTEKPVEKSISSHENTLIMHNPFQI